MSLHRLFLVLRATSPPKAPPERGPRKGTRKGKKGDRSPFVASENGSRFILGDLRYGSRIKLDLSGIILGSWCNLIG